MVDGVTTDSDSRPVGWRPDELLRTLPADRIVPRVGLDQFRELRNVHVLVAPPVPVPLTIPTVFGGKASDVKIQMPANMPAKPDGFWSPVTGPEMTVSRLSDMCCVPGGLAITADGTIPIECFSAPWEAHYHAALYLENGHYRPKQRIVPARRLSGAYFLADYMHLHHYGHFLADVVPRLWGYVWCRDVMGMQDLKLLLHPGLPDYVMALLRGLGIGDTHVERIADPVIVDELFVATKSFQLQDYTSPLAASLFRRIRDTLAPVADTPKRLYLSRSNIPQRVLTNERTIEQLFIARGFEIIHPQELPVVDQITLIANAELIAGPSGSSFFNLAFQRAMHSSFIIASSALVHWSDVFLQAYYKSGIYYFLGSFDLDAPGFRPGDVHAPWQVDINVLQSAVDYWIKRSMTIRPNWGDKTG